jgi:hypothetical protein
VPVLRSDKSFREVRDLSFCYLCGAEFLAADDVDHDHVPPKAMFKIRDRQPALKLKTHKACNAAFSKDDKKLGQLVALRRREYPKSARDIALRLGHYSSLGVGVVNLNVDAAIWRCVRGFHAALYRQPLVTDQFALSTPFPRADKTPAGMQLQPIRAQHFVGVETIKVNRALGNLDGIVANNGKLRYESVWCLADDGVQWLCCFALDIYDWKDLGSHTKEIPARGCVGFYTQTDRVAPFGATLNKQTQIVIPNVDKLDPFAP